MGRPTGAHVRGPLQPLVRGFLSELVELGYSWTAQRSRLRLMAELSSWMAARGIEPQDLTQRLLEEFLRDTHLSHAGARWSSPSSQRQLLGYLRGLGLVPEPPASPPTDPIDRLLTEFGEYLVRERGLTAGSGTVRDYRRVVRQFLSDHIDSDGVLERLTARDVTSFVLAQCRRLPGARSRKLVVTALRQLLRFLFLDGLIAGDLTGAVPRVPSWRGTSLPKAVDPECVGRLLASCDLDSPAGRRDFAIMLTLARLGLRCGEVAAIRLGDVDWRAGEIVVRGKDDRHERLPLPVDAGEALVAYLRHGRPLRDGKHLFLQARAPFALRAGAPLEEVASLLRHRRHATTVVYAKVDWQRLRELARPWPRSAA